MNEPLQLSFDARPTHTIPRHRPVRPLGIEFLEARTMLTTLTDFEPPVVPLSSAQSESLSEVRADALYVWRYPPANGTPVDYAEAQRVANFAGANGISTIYYDNWGCGLYCSDRNRVGAQDNMTLAPIIALLREHDLRVEALYTDILHIEEVLAYNAAVQPNERFDALRLNVEAGSFPEGTWPGGGWEPTMPVDLDVYTDAVSAAGSLPVYASISHHWTELISYNGETKEAYKHILDIVAGVDVQTAQDSAEVIAQITHDEVSYANAINKPAHITIETYDAVQYLGLNDFNTFFEEGEAGMKNELATLDYSVYGNSEPSGFAYHFYRQSFGSSDISGWETNDEGSPMAYVQIIDVTVTEGDQGITSALFNVTRSGNRSSVSTVEYETADGTATRSDDYESISGVLYFGPSEETKTITVSVLGDTAHEPDETFYVNLVGATGAIITDTQATGTIVNDDGPTAKFYVVDVLGDEVFRYDSAGTLVGNDPLTGGNNAPRGAAANPDGTTLWIIDRDGYVYVYDAQGMYQGAWQADGPDRPEGIAMYDEDIWIVDRGTDKVYLFEGAAVRTSGSQNATSSFTLNNANRNPRGITTDGVHLWVVNAAGKTDKVFKYEVDGTLLGSWTIDNANRNPSGITIDPNDVDHVWVVDNGTDKIHQYNGGATRISGSQTADVTLNLAAVNTNPQGIADPRAHASPLTMTRLATETLQTSIASDVGRGTFDTVKSTDARIHDRQTASRKHSPRLPTANEVISTFKTLEQRGSVLSDNHNGDAVDLTISEFPYELGDDLDVTWIRPRVWLPWM